MSNEQIIVHVPIGAPNDEKEISKVLKENNNRKLKKAELENSNVKLTFSEADIPDYPKRILQVSKRKYDDVYKRIIHVLENEELPKLFKRHKNWLILTIIELSDKWLVFMV